jgi:hypothetical protein
MAEEFKPVFQGPSEFDTLVKKHGSDETRQKQMDLPGGITNGVARLTSCYFGVIGQGDNKGKKFWRASGTVVEPHEVTVGGRAVPVYGLQTSIMITLVPGKDRDGKVIPLEDIFARVMNEIRLLGGSTKVSSAAALEQVCKVLVQKKPYFRFSTRQMPVTDKYPNPKVTHTWYGAVPNYTPQSGNGSVATGVVDSTKQRQAPAQATQAAPVEGHHEEPEPEEGEAFDEMGDTSGSSQSSSGLDLDELTPLAESEDADAQKAIQQAGLDAGMTREEVEDESLSWTDLAEIVKKRRAETAAEPEKEEEPEVSPAEPSEGMAVKYVVLKDGKPETGPRNKVKPPMDCEVVKVNKRGKTADLKAVGSDRTFSKVPWDQLIVE